MKPFDDRRKFPRFDVSLKVEFSNSKDAQECFKGITQNFSRSGCGLVFEKLDETLGKDSSIEFKIQDPLKNDSFSKVEGVVVWKKQISGKWYVGINLNKIDKTVKMDILEFALVQWIDQAKNT